MRIIVAALGLLLVSCGADDSELTPVSREGAPSRSADQLTGYYWSTYWASSPPSTPITIPVCWVASGFEAEKAIGADAIRATWGRVANLDFTFKLCGAGEPASIRINVVQATDSGGGGNSALGKTWTFITSTQRGLTDGPAGVSSNWNINTLSSGYPVARIRNLAIHEMGHALNFFHEQDSPASSCGGTPWDGATPIGAWDAFSVMLSGNSGCNNNRYANALGYLSPLDRSGARSIYGTRKVRSRGDFAFQGQASVGVWRPGTGYWYINDGVTTAVSWGGIVNGVTDEMVAGDYDGDGKVNSAIWRPSDGKWYVNDGVTVAKEWGQSGDIPVPCDYNGDGKTDRAIYRPPAPASRPGTGTWYIDDGQTSPTLWGESGDFVVPADYTGDGKCDIAVYRPSTGKWWINAASGIFDLTLSQNGIPVPGDYAGEGLVRPALWFPSTGLWEFAPVPTAVTGQPVVASPTSLTSSLFLGSTGDIPVSANYNGDGIDIPAIFHPQTGNTYFWQQGGIVSYWGDYGDVPTTRVARMTTVP